MPDSPSSSRRAVLALLLTVPAPSVGVIAGMMLWQGPVGQAVFVVSKLWMALLPVFWWTFVDLEPLSWSPPRKGGFVVGAATGLAIAGIILGGFFLLRDWVIPPADAEKMRAAAVENGLSNAAVYLGGCLYWITVNSLLEEYVYRWFLVTKSETALAGTRLSGRWRTWSAILASAAFFTIHHVLAMAAQGLSWRCIILANIGVFTGGAIWSWMYERYRSVWPGYLSHAIVDVPVFVIGWMLIQPT